LIEGSVVRDIGFYNWDLPEPGAVQLENVVPFRFDYQNALVNNGTELLFDRVGIEVVNAFTPQAGTSTYTFSASGASVETTLVLPTGLYNVRLFLSPPVGGATSTVFYSESRQVNVIPDSIEPGADFVQATGTPSIITTTYNASGGGTTTLTYIQGDKLSGNPALAVLYTRLPFSYIMDFWNLLGELGSGVPEAHSTIGFDLPTGAVYTDPITSATTSHISMIDFEEVGELTIVQTSRALIATVMYFMTSLYVVTTVLTIL